MPSKGARVWLVGVLMACVAGWWSPAMADVVSCAGVPWSREDPCLTLTPPAGPVGTRVHISGQLPAGQIKLWRAHFRDNARDPLYGLTGDFGSCEIIGGIDRLHVAADRRGAVHGSFVVTGGSASCKQEGGRQHRFVPGAYTLDVDCMACGIAVFTITASDLASTGPATSIRDGLASSAVAVALGAALVLLGRRRRPPGRPRAGQAPAGG